MFKKNWEAKRLRFNGYQITVYFWALTGHNIYQINTALAIKEKPYSVLSHKTGTISVDGCDSIAAVTVIDVTAFISVGKRMSLLKIRLGFG